MVFEELLNFDERSKVERKMKMIVLLSSLLLGILVSGFRQGSKVYGLGRSSLKALRLRLELVGDVCSFSDRTLKLRTLLQQKQLSVMPCCYDGLSARMIESAGFNITFMTGFGVSATYGFPDMGQVTASEMFSSARTIANSLKSIPCVGDGDTGYGNVLNIRRTVLNYARAGMSSIMIEDQLSPKRCGHTPGKEVVSREEAFSRIQAAVDARDEYKRLYNLDILILARTDARIISLDEAIHRCQKFREIGADWTFLEAPKSEDEMYRYCKEVSGPKLANMLEFGHTPILPPKKLEEIGYTVAAYPVTLLSASARAMKQSLELLKHGHSTDSNILSFEDLKEAVGFPEFYQILNRYSQK